jgi:uncharacterized repeat protein (TIGR03917 family)
MGIFSSGDHGAWRTPAESSPLVSVHATATGVELTIRPGADIGDLVAILADLPAEAFFTEHFGDVDAILVFRNIPAAGALVPAIVTPSADPAAAGAPRP